MEMDSEVKKITYISVGIAAMIVGGFTIYHLSLFIPIPGVKYILMSPYLSMVIFILLSKIKGKRVLPKIGITFGFIMMVINIYMGIAIIITTLATQLSIFVLPEYKKAFYGAVFFSAYTGLFSLLIAKLLIGGAFKEISTSWIIFASVLCLVSGLIGTFFAKKIMKHIIKYSFE